ncbi:MipA/OmpV family protein [Novosphingobium sp. TCA1]|uniref:MipA/OmpV family protein n=1 Tax=Novosphingobium sp. TCA1 TaxID=2682474 RepID=UPI0013576267|nr:MipA/OmpV family protein [Novosphingobium sp. TCA1]
MTTIFGRSFSHANGAKADVSKIPAVRVFTLCLAGSLVPGAAMAKDGEQTPHMADHVTIGAGATVLPTFEGSDSTRVLPLPVIDIRQGIFVANTYSGIGVSVPVTDEINMGAGAVFVLGYRQKDVPTGIERIKNAAGIRANATIRKWGFVSTVGVTKVLGGTKGTVADAVISYPVRLDDHLTIVPGLGTTWADSKYNDRYFGISPEEAAASGLSRFSPGSGFKDVTFNLVANYRLSPRWNLSVGGSAIRVVGDVSDSPLVQDKLNASGFASISYTFGR